jgi:hypothetical protein
MAAKSEYSGKFPPKIFYNFALIFHPQEVEEKQEEQEKICSKEPSEGDPKRGALSSRSPRKWPLK